MMFKSGAQFSPCRAYRYALWRNRSWESAPKSTKGYIMFIGLNPSTADETKDDPTIRRCLGYCRSWGYIGFVMVNLFAFRATEPEVMMAGRR